MEGFGETFPWTTIRIIRSPTAKETGMEPKHRWAKGVVAFAVLVALAAGCQSPGTPQAAGPAVVPEGSVAEPPLKLTDAQRADLKIALGRNLEREGNLDRAIDAFSEAAAKNPTRLDACLHLAALHERQGHLTESREWYRKALALGPNNADVYCNLGYSHYLQGDWVQAAKYLRHAVELQPNHARAHNNLGLVLARLWQSNEALAEFKKAGCNDADAYINLGYCFMVEGNTAQAQQYFNTALELDPKSAPAKKALQDLSALAARVESPRPVTAAAGSSDGPPTSPVIQTGAWAGAGKKGP
jgi:Tfp pilus assembly protein PilF